MAEEAKDAIILDTGSFSCKAGLSKHEAPLLVVRTLVSFAKGSSVPACFGRECLEKPEELYDTRPLINYKDPDWERIEKFWGALAVVNPEIDFTRKPLLTGYHPLASKFFREKTAQIFFEGLGVPSYFTTSNALLVLYSSGKVSGLVLDSGQTYTSVVPIYDGSPLVAAQATHEFAGHNVTDYLRKHLKIKGLKEATELKEKQLRITLDYAKEQVAVSTLPDGEQLPASVRLTAAESVFMPELADSISPGPHELAFESLLRTDNDLRREFVNNMVISGGNTAFANYNERLQKEMSMLLPGILKVKCHNLPERSHSVWYGGAIVSSLAQFRAMWVTRADYEEIGPGVVSRKCV